jgi:dipeptidyl aminopeptidase/acylaminoacyl peptidase
VHEADNNPGTFTLQTERYFQALKGLGAPVRMVILPKEAHAMPPKRIYYISLGTRSILRKISEELIKTKAPKY